MLRRKTYVALFLAAAAVAATARADSFSVGKQPYSDIEIIGFQDNVLRYRFWNRREATKDLDEVTLILIDGQASFNDAEKLLAAGKYAEAADKYDGAARAADKAWLKELIRYRRLSALSGAGKVGDAVELWLGLVSDSGASAKVIALAPTKPGAKGSQDNKKAISLLEQKLASEKSKPLVAAMQALLLKLYGQEDDPKAGELAANMTGGEPSPVPQPGDKRTSGSLAGHLLAVETLLKNGRASLALRRVEERLRDYSPSELPRALLLAGRARLAIHETGKDREVLLEAGLNLMTIVVHFPQTTEAAWAMFHSGEVNEKLGNLSAARKAYEAVLTRYSKAEAAPQAKSALGELNERLRQRK